MDNDWDLFAVVKSCTAAAFSSSTTTTSTTAPVNNINISAAEGRFLSSGSMSTFLDDDTPFVFPSLKEDRPDGAFEGLEEFCKEFSIDLALAAAASGIISTTTNTLPVGEVFRQQIQPSQGIHQMQPQHLNLQMQTENPLIGSSLSIRKTNSQPSRPRKRKNQRKKVVRIMTPEELYADSWAWRKYGQKPIKGSPYPRNYYRCSTSKGCAARKHVEKNPADPALFLVSYSGEHTHPRPYRWSSFSRSTQTKLISPATTTCEPSTNVNIPIGLPNSSRSSSSLASSSSFSPTTPLVEGENPSQNEDVEMVKEHVEVEYEDEDVEMVKEHVEVEYEDEDEDILIPNVSMSEEIFRGFRELGVINNGSDHSSDLQTQPWTSTSSTATFNASGRGGD